MGSARGGGQGYRQSLGWVQRAGARVRSAALGLVGWTRPALGAATSSARAGPGVSRMASRHQPVVALATRWREAGRARVDEPAADRRTGRPPNRHARALIVATLVIAIALLTGCDRQERILTGEPFRLVEPDNAELLDEVVDDGESLIKDGERSVLRIFVPRPPAEPTDVVDVLVAEAERTGREVVDRSPLRAVARKEVEGRQWTASVSVEGDRVRQLLAGR